MNKLAVIVPFYKRAELTELCFENLKRQSKLFKFDVYTAGSEGQDSKNLAEKFSFKYIETPNNPVSEKNNLLIQSTKKKKYDGIVLVGSDNFVSDSVFETYLNIDLKKEVMYGFDDLYFYRTSDKKLGTKGEYNLNKITIGVGRLFSTLLLKQLNYIPWNVSAENGLDNIVSNNVKSREEKLSLGDMIILDVKHSYNISRHSIIDTCELVDLSILSGLGDISKKILELTPSKEITVIPRGKKDPTKTIEMIKDVAGMVIGQKKTLPAYTANLMVKYGSAKFID